ncbi:translation initiation factor 2 [Pseudomonas sp. SCB32]|uniref:translation initiation factor 2 n=1 Tax=Pseudomonas sp. SCB32 TaxID=2653853 RepID=UPI0012646730|nr:translation initiation factor 2 [Pseudomonas sp. SCB32]
MTPSRILLAACLTLLLAACGDEHKDKAPSPSPAQSAGEPAPASTPAPKPSAEQPRESEAAPAAAEPVASAKAPAVEAATKPEAKAPTKSKSESEHGDKTEPKARAAKKAALDPVVKQPLPPVKLDLRLPKDLVQQLQPDKPVPELEEKPLLPPMFVEKSGQSPFQVGGRLIQREHNEREPSDESWHSDIRGAELQFQFRN